MKKAIALIAALMLVCAAACAAAETRSFSRVREALQWIQENQPAELDLGETRFQPLELLQLQGAMPPGGKLTWKAVFRKAEYTPETEHLDLNGQKSQISAAELRALIELLPELKSVDVAGHRELSNKVMPEIADANPGIRFTWLMTLPYNHSLSTGFTAYSTMNHLDAKRFSESSLELFRYAPGIRALDLGHNAIVHADFLRYMPDLELLILADNRVAELDPVGELKQLRYLEIFMNDFSDLSPLSGCGELLDLNIVRTKVTSLDGLDGCEKLERLWAPQRKQLDEASIARFTEKHPDCQLAFGTGDATGQGWRDHWRYKHYVACFKSHQWIPFEESSLRPADNP